MFRNPLDVMKLRTASLDSALGASFGRVRNYSPSRDAYTRNHQGWDLEAPIGTTCRAIADGWIEEIRTSPSYGRQIFLGFSRWGTEQSQNEGDVLYAQYAHLSDVLVSEGDEVRAGQAIARTGASGNASTRAPHLHLEIRTTMERSRGLTGRVDPAVILGHHHLRSS